MPPRLSLKTFLSSARAALTAPASSRRNAPLTFVVGNESADLDSLCSAVVCAYFRSHSSPHVLHIPLSNLPRADLALRTEMAAVLRHAGLVPDDLLTLSELPDLKPDEARWFLVDHNALTGDLKRFQGQVVGVVDHHVDEMVTPDHVVPRVVEPCGSCTSLIIEEYRSTWDSLLPPIDIDGKGDHQVDHVEDEQLAKLSLAPILIDTLNMTEESKVKEKDIRALAYLKTKIRSQGFDQISFFDEISAVKEDISGLSFRDILRKDYKEWEEAGLKLGISCAVQNFDFLLGKEKESGGKGSFIASLGDWAAERHLDVASVMTVSHLKNPNGEFQRHLLVWGITEGGIKAFGKFPAIAEGLGLESWRDGLLDEQGGRRMAWRQWDLTSSRKQVAPLLREALKAVAGSS